MTSGRKSLTAAVSAFWSKRSHKIGVTPAARSGSIFSGVRVIAATTCPSASMSGSKRLPITPVAPAKKIRILLPHIIPMGYHYNGRRPWAAPAAQSLGQSAVVLELFELPAINGRTGHAALVDVSNRCTVNQQAEQLRTTVVTAPIHEPFALVDHGEIEVGDNFTLAEAQGFSHQFALRRGD